MFASSGTRCATTPTSGRPRASPTTSWGRGTAAEAKWGYELLVRLFSDAPRGWQGYADTPMEFCIGRHVIAVPTDYLGMGLTRPVRPGALVPQTLPAPGSTLPDKL